MLRFEYAARCAAKSIVIVAAIAFAALGGARAYAQQAPDGFKNAGSASKGISLIVPQYFDEIPVAPGNETTALRFIEKEFGNKPKSDAEIRILTIQIPEATIITGAASRPESAPAPKPPAAPRGFNTFEEFVKKTMPGWECGANGSVDGMSIKKLDRFTLTNGKAPVQGVAYVVKDDDRFVCFVGFGRKDDFIDIGRKYERCAKYLKIGEAKETSAELDKLYKSKKFRGVEYRLKVRDAMSKGWKAEDTENFILIYNISDKTLINKMKHSLEVLREKLEVLFPPVREVVEVSTVRICKDRDEFLKFSEIPKNLPVAGFWNSRTQELVFYNNVKDPTYPTASWEDACIVLYHESFHQYIYYACGELDPHSWFNEGYGDYFSGSKISSVSTKVEKIGPNPWRVANIKRMVAEKTFAPLEKLVRFEQQDYYSRPGEYYAQGWSFIYFLNDPAVIKKHPSWGKILRKYLSTLIQTYQSELTKLGAERNPENVAKARLTARNTAVDAAFEDIKFDELESAWKSFVEALPDIKR
ncbi:MAG: hypothetical protein ACKVS6_14955 [Planctomycetota bacterium]